MVRHGSAKAWSSVQIRLPPFLIAIYRNLSEKKARLYGLFYFYFWIKKDNFKNLLGRGWGEVVFLAWILNPSFWANKKTASIIKKDSWWSLLVLTFKKALSVLSDKAFVLFSFFFWFKFLDLNFKLGDTTIFHLVICQCDMLVATI